MSQVNENEEWMKHNPFLQQVFNLILNLIISSLRQQEYICVIHIINYELVVSHKCDFFF